MNPGPVTTIILLQVTGNSSLRKEPEGFLRLFGYCFIDAGIESCGATHSDKEGWKTTGSQNYQNTKLQCLVPSLMTISLADLVVQPLTYCIDSIRTRAYHIFSGHVETLSYWLNCGVIGLIVALKCVKYIIDCLFTHFKRFILWSIFEYCRVFTGGQKILSREGNYSTVSLILDLLYFQCGCYGCTQFFLRFVCLLNQWDTNI